MRIKDFQAFEKQAQSPGNWYQSTRDGRREGDAMKFIMAIGKQSLDLGRTNAARLRIGGVEPEVVGKDHPTVSLDHTGTLPVLSPQRFQNFKRPAQKPKP